MCTRATLAEVRQLQKAAGILNENDIDYSLDEMLDDEGMLNEKATPPCGHLKMANGERHELTKYINNDGTYSCFDLKSPSNVHGGPDLKGRRLAAKDETDWTMTPTYYQEDAVPKPTGPAACPPGYTSYATGLDPNGVACIRGQAPKSINGKAPKKVASVAPKPQMQAEDRKGMLNEKMKPCGYLIMAGGSMAGQRHDLTLFSDGNGHFSCFDLQAGPDTKRDLRGYTRVPDGEIDWSIERKQVYSAESLQEDAVPKPTGPGTCPPGYTSYATGLDPNSVVCLQGPAPKSINGKPPKKVASTTASKPGAPVPLKEKAPLPGCGPMWDGQKAVEGVRWMLDGDPGRHSTCLLPGRKPDFKVEFGGRLYSLVPYTNQESVQEAVGVSAAAPCGPTFTAISTGPKPTDYACFPTNGLPQKINGKPPQKKVGSSTAPVGLKPGMKPQMEAEEKRLNYKDKPNFGFEPEDKKIRGTWILDNEGESVYLIKKCPSYANFLARVEDRMSKDPDFAAAYEYFSENVEYFAEPLIDNEEYGDFDDIFGEDFTERSQAEPDDILTFDEWANDITAVWKRDFNG